MNLKRNFWKSPFVIFTLILAVKIYLTWYVIFGATIKPFTMLVGLPSVWVIFFLVEWLASKRKLIAYILVDLLVTAIYFAAIMYYQYYGVIVTYRALQQVGQVTEVKGSVMQLMHPYFLLIFIDIIVFFILLGAVKSFRSWGRGKTSRTIALAGLALTLAFSFMIAETNKGITNEVQRAQSMGILNYEVLTIFSDMNRDYMDPKLVTPQAISNLKGTQTLDNPLYKGVAKGRNVIVIQVESLQNILINMKLGGKELTPNLNKLVKESMYFPHFYQMAGQGNTSDAEYLLNTSLYIPPDGAASQSYVDKNLPSLPKLFSKMGYKTMTFHTNDVTFWNRKELYASLGFDKYYDKSFFKDEDFLFFGASDPVLFRKSTEVMVELQKNNQPFYANLITMSSHHPFNIPASKRQIELPKAFKGTFVGDYLTAQNYADYSLGLFFDELKAAGIWDNSVIVIYGDHLGLPMYSLTDYEKSLLKDTLGRDYSYADMLNIPLIVAAPGAVEPAVNPQTGGEVDLMPTIANLTDVDLSGTIHFGQDIVNQKSNLLPERYYLPSGSYIDNNKVFIPGKSEKDGESYTLTGLQPVTNQAATEDAYKRAMNLLALCDTYVEHLSQR
ncbi:LTA synthase family protein [Gorillibacterium massiliense]|uniref:LTA synthase family protein n=1 Tax=Gorillibacterium massiliense TaxID=1280390 RepID=UPI0004B57ABE|nr:LTA synthase family protein [Gorillibacterium massiliense]